MNIIETKNLTKVYGDFTAVSGVNLHIQKGTVYGFLGPNHEDVPGIDEANRWFLCDGRETISQGPDGNFAGGGLLH